MVRFVYMKQLPSAMPASIARNNFYQIVEEAGEDRRQFIIVPRSKPPVVIMSVQEFESLQETLEIMSDKKLVARITQARKDFTAKKGIPEKKVNKMLGWK